MRRCDDVFLEPVLQWRSVAHRLCGVEWAEDQGVWSLFIPATTAFASGPTEKIV